MKKKIKDGEYNYEETIPSESELTQLYNVSRHTIREVISLLAKEGVVRKERGSGTYVSYYINKYTNEKTLIIGVITTYMSDYIFPSIIRGIEENSIKKISAY